MSHMNAQIVQRDDGLWSIGWHDDAAGPFETRAFAEAVAHEVARAEWLRRNSRHSPLLPGSI
jgi:hypothetical protein